jgi:hypothetical protein
MTKRIFEYSRLEGIGRCESCIIPKIVLGWQGNKSGCDGYDMKYVWARLEIHTQF